MALKYRWQKAHSALQLEYGIRTNGGNSGEEEGFNVFTDEGISDRRYSKIKSEIRYYHNHTTKDSAFIDYFFGYSFLFTPQTFIKSDSKVILKNYDEYSFSQAKYRRNVFIGTIMGGFKVWLDKRAFLELYAGVGIKYTRIRVKEMKDKQFIRTYPEDEYIGPFDYFKAGTRRERDLIYPSLDLGLKLGVRI